MALLSYARGGTHCEICLLDGGKLWAAMDGDRLLLGSDRTSARHIPRPDAEAIGAALAAVPKSYQWTGPIPDFARESETMISPAFMMELQRALFLLN